MCAIQLTGQTDHTPDINAGFTRAGVLVAVFAVALAAIGGWAVWASRTQPPAIGEPIGYDGGEYTVVGAFPVDDPMAGMTAANSQQFAASGMSMSQMLPDAVPDGMKRVAVEVVLTAGDQPMEFPADSTRLTVNGTPYEHYRALLGDERLNPGEAISGVVTYEVPVGTSLAQFTLATSTPAVTVDVSGGDTMDMGDMADMDTSPMPATTQ